MLLTWRGSQEFQTRALTFALWQCKRTPPRTFRNLAAKWVCRHSTRRRANLQGGESRCPITIKYRPIFRQRECAKVETTMQEHTVTGRIVRLAILSVPEFRYPRQLHNRRNRTASSRLRCGRRCRSGIHWPLFRGRQGRSERCLRTTTLNCCRQLSVGCSLRVRDVRVSEDARLAA